jgi:hypothetical protein
MQRTFNKWFETMAVMFSMAGLVIPNTIFAGGGQEVEPGQPGR